MLQIRGAGPPGRSPWSAAGQSRAVQGCMKPNTTLTQFTGNFFRQYWNQTLGKLRLHTNLDQLQTRVGKYKLTFVNAAKMLTGCWQTVLIDLTTLVFNFRYRGIKSKLLINTLYLFLRLQISNKKQISSYCPIISSKKQEHTKKIRIFPTKPNNPEQKVANFIFWPKDPEQTVGYFLSCSSKAEFLSKGSTDSNTNQNRSISRWTILHREI